MFISKKKLQELIDEENSKITKVWESELINYKNFISDNLIEMKIDLAFVIDANKAERTRIYKKFSNIYEKIMLDKQE